MTKSDHQAKPVEKLCQNWCKAARAENQRLLEQIRQLKGEIALRDSLFGESFKDNTFETQEIQLSEKFPFYSKLTISEREVFRLIFKQKGKIARKANILSALCQLRPESEWPEDKIVDVFVCKIRKKMLGHPWRIETHWGEGYSLKNLGGV